MPRLSSVSSRSLTGQGVGKTVSVSSITPAASSINEGSGLTFNVVTANATSGSTLYWTVNHTSTASADFSATSGSFTVTNNAGSFTVTPTADVNTEGAETFTVSVRSGSISGTVLGTSSSVTVNDTSTTPVAVSVTSYYGASGQSTTVSSTRLSLVSSAQARFGTQSLQGTTVQAFLGRANAVNITLPSTLLPPLTIEAWVYCSVGYASPDWQGSPPIYLHGPEVDVATTNPSNSIRLYGTPANVYGISYSDQIVQGGLIIGGGNDSGATPIPLNTWQHMALAIAADGTTKSVWVNGTRRSSAPISPALTASMTTLTLNAFGSGSGPQYIDEIRVSNIDRYGVSNATITVPTSQFTSDANTLALVHF